MNKLKELNEKRAATVAKMQALVDKAQAETRSMTDEENAEFDRMRGEVESVDAEIRRQEFMDSEKNKKPVPTPVDFRTQGKYSEQMRRDMSRFSLSRACAQHLGQKRFDGVEAEVQQHFAEERAAVGASGSGVYIPEDMIRFSRSRDLQKRDFTIGTEGADVMQTDIGELIPILKPEPLLRSLGARFITGLRGDFQLPRVSGRPSLGWYTETGASSETTPTTDNIKLAPKRTGGYIDVSRMSMIQSSFAMDQVIIALLNDELAIEVDKQGFQGPGTGNKPTGIIYTSGIGTVSFGAPDGGAPTWAKVLEFWKDIATANANKRNSAYVTTPAAVAKLMSTAKVSSTDSVMIAQVFDQLAGYKMEATNQLPVDLTEGSGTDLSAMVFGDFSQAYLGFFGGVNLIMDEVTQAASSLIRIHIEQFMDVKLAQPAAFSVALDMVTA